MGILYANLILFMFTSISKANANLYLLWATILRTLVEVRLTEHNRPYFRVDMQKLVLLITVCRFIILHIKAKADCCGACTTENMF